MRLNGIDFDLVRIGMLCKAAGVTRAWLFGSILTDQFSLQSDIDLMVETDTKHPPGVLKLGGLQMDLTELLGRHVHLTLLGGVPVQHRAGILAKAQMLSAA
ncbi:MAG: nucleotidyltransferase domain-containing protein [Phycisphaerales bacterium]|nr:nucleotidyltransferase domain-containing protein [Phycisphaerales bacterium]